MKIKKKALIFIYLVVVIALICVVYVIPEITGALKPTEILAYGTLSQSEDVTAYIVRDEMVYVASQSGDTNYYYADGTKIRKNSTVMQVIGNGKTTEEESEYQKYLDRLEGNTVQDGSYLTTINGIVCYYIDGYENYFTPDTIASLDYDEVKGLDIYNPVNLTRTETYKGDPLFKICANDEWFIVIWVPDASISRYQLDNSVTVRMEKGSIKGRIAAINDCGDTWQIVIRSNRYYEDFARVRTCKAEIVTSEIEGVIVPNASIASENEQIGVYVKSKTGDYNFTPIKIKTSDGVYSVVYDSYYYDDEGKMVYTVDIYDEILKKP